MTSAAWVEAAELAQERLARVDRIALDLARALMRCQSFLPLFIEPGQKLQRATAAHDEATTALDAFCSYAGTTPQRIWTKEAAP